MKLIKMKCENCGATIEVDKSLDKITCSYCRAEILIDDEASELKRVEDVKLQARKQNHEQSLKERQEKLEQDLKEKEVLDKVNAKEKFKKGKLSKVLLIFFAISIISFFIASGFLAKSLSLIQAGLFISAWLMGMEIIKEPIKGLKIILSILAFVLIIPIVNTGAGITKEYEKINWDYIVLKEHLPQPSGTKGDITTNSDDSLSVDISVKSEDEYREYIEQCKDFGYTIDAKNDTNSYSAKNEDGYKLRIWYYDSMKEYNISLDVKEEIVPEETTPEKPAPEETSQEPSTSNDNEIKSDFRNAMDSYEKFIDEYIAITKKYNSNPSDISLLQDYTNYVEKLSEMEASFNKWNDEDLNDAEMKYFIEVQTRVNKKLADVALSY